ncbi:hypothetical protein DFJ77DRAFT_468416 [Powellomyces hirtus]|nr:hypothetical protein DFJ77DRAFT_468416 [Powellomyces hirtus]
MSHPPPPMPPRPQPRTSSSGATTLGFDNKISPNYPTTSGAKEVSSGFAASFNNNDYNALLDDDDVAQDDVDLGDSKTASFSSHGSGHSNSGGGGGGAKPSLSTFKQKFRTKASEAAKVTAEWRAKAAEKGTELQAKAKVAVAEWESKAKERTGSHRSNSGTTNSPNGNGSADSVSITNPIFGVSVADALERSRITLPVVDTTQCNLPDHLIRHLPAVFYRCVEFLNLRGLDEIGIYRISGSTSEVAQIRAQFNSGLDVDLTLQHIDCNAVASLFKAWLRELPESILTDPVALQLSRLYSNTADNEPTPQLIAETRATIAAANLPYLTRALCYTLFGHLANVASKEGVNKMSVGNLQVIFCPTLGIGSALFRCLVSEYEMLFGGIKTETPPPLPVVQTPPSIPQRSSRVGSQSADVMKKSSVSTLSSSTAGVSPPNKPVRPRPSSISATSAFTPSQYTSSSPPSNTITNSGSRAAILRPSSAGETSSPSVISSPTASTVSAPWDTVTTTTIPTSRPVPSATMRVSWGSGKESFTNTTNPNSTFSASSNHSYTNNNGNPLPSATTVVTPSTRADDTSALMNLMDDMDPFADDQVATPLMPTMIPTPAPPPRHNPQQQPQSSPFSLQQQQQQQPIWTPPRVGSLEYTGQQYGMQTPQNQQYQQQQQKNWMGNNGMYTHGMQQQPQQQQQYTQQQQQNMQQQQQQQMDLQPPARFDSWKPTAANPEGAT